MTNNHINRREALQRTAMLLGVALSGSAIAGVLNGCRPEMAASGAGWQPAVLSPEQLEQVKAIADRILPRTETPSATEVGVHQFIDRMLKEYYLEEERNLFLGGLDKINSSARVAHGMHFPECSTEQQDSILTSAAREAAYAVKRAKPGEKIDQPFFYMIKELTLLGYFTSEVGASEVLQYDPNPGGFQGCVPLEELGGKIFAI